MTYPWPRCLYFTGSEAIPKEKSSQQNGGIPMDIYEPVIAEMKAQIEECQRVIVTLEMMRSKGAIGLATNAAPSVSQSAVFSNDAFFGMTIAEAVKKFLTGTKKTATAKIIADALVAGGFKTSAKNFVETVRSIVSRHHYFSFVNGEFGLSEWYPGRKAATRKASSGTGVAETGVESDTEPTTEEVDAVIAQVSTEQPPPSEK
jgi:hypothetical protein